jgi:hypothetical protein
VVQVEILTDEFRDNLAQAGINLAQAKMNLIQAKKNSDQAFRKADEAKITVLKATKRSNKVTGDSR